jgi:uncharacterized NAD-dependent epimerase/dehydratase family protein
VVALLDSTQAGKTAGEVMGFGGSIPFIAGLSQQKDADTLLIGIAPAGGSLPESWRPVIREAIERGMQIVSGLHFFIGEDPEFKELAKKHGVNIYDVRKPPPDVTVSKNIAKDTPCYRVHTVGNDCNVGKMTTALEVAAGLSKRGHKAEFVATGQTGIMISGWGVAVDRVISDFVAGATEQMIIDHQNAEFLLIEGQGSLIHPLSSGVTLGLLHGCAPQALIMCFEAGRSKIRHAADMDLPPMDQIISIYETMASIITPAKVIGFGVNTRSLAPEAARKEIESVEDRFGLPATDPIRFGVDKLVDAVLGASGKMTRVIKKKRGSRSSRQNV